MNHGKLLILVMIAAGIIAGTLKVWQQHRHMQRVLDSLSPRVVQSIAEAREAEVLKLVPAAESELLSAESRMEIEGRVFKIVDRKSVAKAKGFADVRVRLVDDQSYRWDIPARSNAGSWHYVLQFTDDKQQTPLAFDIQDEKHSTLLVLDSGMKLVADPIADGLKSFFAAQFDESTALAP